MTTTPQSPNVNASAKYNYSEAFIRDIPKTDLHLHLDGSIRLSTLIECAKQKGIKLPSYTEEGLKELVFKDSYKDLGEYLHGFMYTCEVLRDLENLERCSYELAIDNQLEGVRYIEPRFAPQLLMDNGSLTMEAVFESVEKGLARASKEFNSKSEVVSGAEPAFAYGIIACAMRMFGKSSFSPYYTSFYQAHKYSSSNDVIRLGAMELAQGIIKIRDEKDISIVSIDLAGQEAGYPAENFKDAYSYVHRNFMHKTVHAGEAYGAESIFQALTELNADRLGHGYYLFDADKIEDKSIVDKNRYIEELASIIAEKRITVEVCLTSNCQTNPALKNIKDHSFKKMLEHKISATLCTDNRLISSTTVSKEVKLAVENFDISPSTLKNLIVYGFKRSFYPGTYVEKRAYVKSIMNHYEAIEKKHGIC